MFQLVQAYNVINLLSRYSFTTLVYSICLRGSLCTRRPDNLLIYFFHAWIYVYIPRVTQYLCYGSLEGDCVDIESKDGYGKICSLLRPMNYLTNIVAGLKSTAKLMKRESSPSLGQN